MKNNLLQTLMGACVCVVSATNVGATERYHTSTLKSVYPQGNGDFVLVFDTDTTQCALASGSPKYQYVVVGQNGVNAEGSKKIYAAALSAVITRATVDIAFDDATVYCYINRLVVRAN
jgi:hypothetical protein